jgi:hypothetical protein
MFPNMVGFAQTIYAQGQQGIACPVQDSSYAILFNYQHIDSQLSRLTGGAV